MVVDAWVDNVSAIDGNIAVVLPEIVKNILFDIVWDFAAVFPDEITRDGVDRLDDISGVWHIHDPVVDQWCALLPSRRESP